MLITVLDIESAPSNAVRNYVERAEGNVSRFDSLLKSVTRERDELVMHLDTASAEIKDLRVQAGLLAEQHSAFRSDNAALRDRLDRSVPLNHNEPKHSQQHEKAKRESHLEGQTTQSLGRIESSLAAIDIKLLCAEAENLKARLARAVRQTDRDPQQLKARASKLIDDLTEQTATRSGFSMQVPQPGEADAQSDGIAGSLYAETLSTGGRNRTRTGVSGKVEAESRQKDAEAIAPKTLDNIRESKRVVDGSTRPSGEQRRGLRVERQRSAPRASNELSSSSAKKKPLEDYCDDDGCIEKKAASSMKRNSNNKLSAPSQTRPSEQGLGNIPTDDVTFLSAVDTKDISQIRQSLELERLAARRKRQSTQKAEPKGDNTPSNQEMAREQATGKLASTIRLSHQQPAIEDQAGGEEATNTQQTENGANAYASKAGNAEELTAQSLRSNTSRRRRNVPYETTSAFLLPDITLHIGHAADTSQAAPHTCHDPKCCILCTPNASIPAAVAISSRDDTAGADDAETTMRPATMPVHALRVVLKTATDELAHLELQYTATEAAYAALDPAMGKRKRLSIFDRTMGLLRAIEAKKEMIYNLYDVLEGIEQEQEGSTDHFDAGNDANTQTHQAAHAVKGRKHVTIADMPVTAGKNTEAGYSDEEDLYDELPWDGFVDN